MEDSAPKQLTWRWRVIPSIIIAVVRLLRWRIDVRGLELPLMTWAARRAQEADIRIVPVAGWGTQRELTRGGSERRIRELPESVWFGPPLGVTPEDDPVAA